MHGGDCENQSAESDGSFTPTAENGAKAGVSKSSSQSNADHKNDVQASETGERDKTMKLADSSNVNTNSQQKETEIADKSTSGKRRLLPPKDDPLFVEPPSTVRENDHVILLFGDGRQIFAHCVTSWKGKTPPVKINKRSYPTANLVGLPYGTVLELDHTRGGLVPLPDGEDVVPVHNTIPPGSSGWSDTPGSAGSSGRASPASGPMRRPPADESNSGSTMSVEGSVPSSEEDERGASRAGVQHSAVGAARISAPSSPSDSMLRGLGGRDSGSAHEQKETMPSPLTQQSRQRQDSGHLERRKNDNRNLIDANNAQNMSQNELLKMRNSGLYSGRTIVQCLIENSATFDQKTEFSKAKYIARKQKKYQPRCRMVRCTGPSVAEAMYLKNPRAMLNLREDTMGQILSYANVYGGSQVLVMEGCMGVITGALAQRMGGYGRIVSVYTAQQPPWADSIKKFNLTFAEHQSIKWIHSGEIFGVDAKAASSSDGDPPPPSVVGSSFGSWTNGVNEVDIELRERRSLRWPCPLQDHTRKHLSKFTSSFEQAEFLSKRCNRFARKLTRHTTGEAIRWLHQKSDALIIACRYDPTETVLAMLPYLAASCPFVVFAEHLEPLVECFRELQKQSLAINLRLSDTWLREYQILPGRTHPNMNMSQSGGYLLTGIKLCPVTGHNELEEEVLRDLREKVGGRRGRKKQSGDNKNGRGRGKKGAGGQSSGSAPSGSDGNKGGRESKRARFS